MMTTIPAISLAPRAPAPVPSALSQVPVPSALSQVPVPTVASQATVLVDLKQFEPRLMKAILDAHKVINIEMFNLAPDGSGKRVTEALIAKAKEGVEVNAVLDRTSLVGGWPPWSMPNTLKRLADAGGHFVITNPFSSNPARRNVTHRKVVTIDGTHGFAGGINLSRVTDSYHDAMFEVTGASAAALSVDQLNRWTSLGKTASPVFQSAVSDALAATRLLKSDPAAIQVLDNTPTPGARKSEISDFYRQSIRSAAKRLWIASPAFTDPDMVAEFTAAAARGVDVRVITSGQPPLHLAPISWTTRSAMRALIAAGGHVFETPEVAHTKAMVVDGDAVIGSYNITKRSELHDHEIALTTHEPQVVKQVEQLFLNDIARSQPMTKEQTTTGIAQRATNYLIDKFHLSY